jgi:hypothetical protein
VKALLAAAVLLAGCCNCDHLPPQKQRPGDVVRDLKEAIGDRKWHEAALCFSDDVRRESESFFRRPDGLWPLGPEDTLLGVEVRDGRAIATIDHVWAREPSQLILEKGSDERWHITAWR